MTQAGCCLRQQKPNSLHSAPRHTVLNQLVPGCISVTTGLRYLTLLYCLLVATAEYYIHFQVHLNKLEYCDFFPRNSYSTYITDKVKYFKPLWF